MFDLKVINSVLSELEEVRGISRTSIIEAIEAALATAYKKEYGKKGQIIRTSFNINTGETQFFQVKIVVDNSRVIFNEDEELKEDDEREFYNTEKHILIDEHVRIIARGDKRLLQIGCELNLRKEDKDGKLRS